MFCRVGKGRLTEREILSRDLGQVGELVSIWRLSDPCRGNSKCNGCLGLGMPGIFVGKF